jgi:hypothetical protein
MVRSWILSLLLKSKVKIVKRVKIVKDGVAALIILTTDLFSHLHHNIPFFFFNRAN